MKIGQLRTNKSIENAQREIREWLEKIGINGMLVDLRYDPKQNIAMVSFKFANKPYEFRSTKQSNCRLNMHGIARVMEYKVRAHIMGIEEFESSMKAYLRLTGPAQTFMGNETIPESYSILGLLPSCSNDELKEKHRELMKTWHPDLAGSQEAKTIFEKKAAEVNEAFAEIKKLRGI